MTFNGSTITLWVNGTSVATASSTDNASNTTLQLGKNWGTYQWVGYLGWTNKPSKTRATVISKTWARCKRRPEQHDKSILLTPNCKTALFEQ